MRALVCFLALAAMAQPASACALDGMYGAHRFNPFQGMHITLDDEFADASSDQRDGFDREFDPADNTLESETELAIAEGETDEFQRY